ncbi:MAG: hypothetical protein LBT09_16255 [Planctomycetaceae bacterium]|nr:hypothetical protein [Planctomycetaceae bacterium]
MTDFSAGQFTFTRPQLQPHELPGNRIKLTSIVIDINLERDSFLFPQQRSKKYIHCLTAEQQGDDYTTTY